MRKKLEVRYANRYKDDAGQRVFTSPIRLYLVCRDIFHAVPFPF